MYLNELIFYKNKQQRNNNHTSKLFTFYVNINMEFFSAG